METPSDSAGAPEQDNQAEAGSSGTPDQLSHTANTLISHETQPADDHGRSRKLNRKMDVALLPFLSLLYLVRLCLQYGYLLPLLTLLTVQWTRSKQRRQCGDSGCNILL
jgi:hypothetical protein